RITDTRYAHRQNPRAVATVAGIQKSRILSAGFEDWRAREKHEKKTRKKMAKRGEKKLSSRPPATAVRPGAGSAARCGAKKTNRGTSSARDRLAAALNREAK